MQNVSLKSSQTLQFSETQRMQQSGRLETSTDDNGKLTERQVSSLAMVQKLKQAPLNSSRTFDRQTSKSKQQTLRDFIRPVCQQSLRKEARIITSEIECVHQRQLCNNSHQVSMAPILSHQNSVY